jgi:hypothetical protein
MMWAGTGQHQDFGCLMPTVGYPYQHLGHVMSQHNPASPQQQGTTIFFAGVTPIADATQLLSVFAQFGRVMDLNLFRPYKVCRTTKVKGLAGGWAGVQPHTYICARMTTACLTGCAPQMSAEATLPYSITGVQHYRKLCLDMHAGCSKAAAVCAPLA